MRSIAITVKIFMILLFLPGTITFGETPATTGGKRVNLNTATLEELDAVPGIGEKTAHRIIEIRPIHSLDQLDQLPGFSSSRIKALEEYITLDDGTTTPTAAAKANAEMPATPPVPQVPSKLEAVTTPKPTEAMFEITVAGAQVPVTRIGTGPAGVIFFSHTGARAMNKHILANQDWLKDILPAKCSFFLWEYPQSGPFDKVEPTIRAYREDKTAKLPLPGIAESVVAQIKQKSGLKEFLLIGNSLGAGIVLQGYAQLVKDPSLSFLLISPTGPFLPAPETIPKLERTVLIGSKGCERGEGDQRFSTDPFLKGMDENPEDKEWHWFRENQNVEWGDLIAQSQADIPERVVGTTHYTKPTDFSSGHKTIGFEITNELLSKLIRVKMGWADKAILAEPPKQPNPAYPYYPVSGVVSP